MDGTLAAAGLAGVSTDAVAMLLLWKSIPPERPLIPALRFRLDDHPDANCIKDFRFDRVGVRQLTRLLALPEFVITKNRDKAHCTEALCILLYRLSYPRRQHDFGRMFGRSPSAISRIFAWMSMAFGCI